MQDGNNLGGRLHPEIIGRAIAAVASCYPFRVRELMCCVNHAKSLYFSKRNVEASVGGLMKGAALFGANVKALYFESRLSYWP